MPLNKIIQTYFIEWTYSRFVCSYSYGGPGNIKKEVILFETLLSWLNEQYSDEMKELRTVKDWCAAHSLSHKKETLEKFINR